MAKTIGGFPQRILFILYVLSTMVNQKLSWYMLNHWRLHSNTTPSIVHYSPFQVARITRAKSIKQNFIEYSFLLYCVPKGVCSYEVHAYFCHERQSEIWLHFLDKTTHTPEQKYGPKLKTGPLKFVYNGLGEISVCFFLICDAFNKID